MTVEPIPIVPSVSIELYLIVATPNALYCSAVEVGAATVTDGIET